MSENVKKQVESRGNPLNKSFEKTGASESLKSKLAEKSKKKN